MNHTNKLCWDPADTGNWGKGEVTKRRETLNFGEASAEQPERLTLAHFMRDRISQDWIRSTWVHRVPDMDERIEQLHVALDQYSNDVATYRFTHAGTSRTELSATEMPVPALPSTFYRSYPVTWMDQTNAPQSMEITLHVQPNEDATSD